MNAFAAIEQRGLYRNADKALLGGVCAALAEYFGFNLRVTRFLAFVGFLMAMPMAIITYIVALFLIPARTGTGLRAGPADPGFRKTLRASPVQAASDVRRRFRSLDRRLARMEKYVTSSRYQLDREFRDL
jgi:phage shock protein C